MMLANVQGPFFYDTRMNHDIFPFILISIEFLIDETRPVGVCH